MEPIEVGEVFTITDETNEDQEVEVLAKISVDGAEYVAVAFVEDLKDENEDDIDVFFLKIDIDGEFDYIEDDAEFEKVSEEFDAMLEEQE